jgi:hypothetical protein
LSRTTLGRDQRLKKEEKEEKEKKKKKNKNKREERTESLYQSAKLASWPNQQEG